jgi:hypothetical protein
MEVREADGLIIKPVNIRCLNPRVACASEITISLVVCHHEYDVRSIHFAPSLFLSNIRVWLRNLRFDVLPPLPQGCFHILGEFQFFLGQVVFLAGIVF